MGGDHWMIALRNQHNMVMSRQHDFIQAPVTGIDALNGVPLRSIQLVKVGLLQVGLDQLSGFG